MSVLADYGVNEYIYKILNKSQNKTEQVYLLLSARGFLLDYQNSNIYLSDNSARKDINDLALVLKEGNVGCLENSKIILNDSIDFDYLKNLFKLFNSISHEVEFHMNYKWSKSFGNREHGIKVPVLDLEPFIARYIKAISSIGLLTTYSCDGNHTYPNGCLHIKFKDRYSAVWHDIINGKIINDNINQSFNWIYSDDCIDAKIKFTEANRLDCYYELLCRANYLYDNRKSLRNLKRNLVKLLNNKPKNMLSNSEIYNLMNKSYFEIAHNQN